MTLRTEEVRPPSLRAESLAVAKAAFFVVFCAGVVIALERGAADALRSQTAGAGVAPDAASAPWLTAAEVAFADLGSADQRTFRAVQEGVTEAENQRAATGQWPTAEALAAQGIPPFALDPIDHAHYAWTFTRKGLTVNYLGTPTAASGRPCFLAIILEPDPALPVDPRAPSDEIHHRLSDGTMLHVSIWKGPPLAELAEPTAVAPVGKGWSRIAVSGSGN